MTTVVDDTWGNHWGNMGGRCSARFVTILRLDINHVRKKLTEVLAPYGISGDDAFDIFKVFLNVDLQEDGGFALNPTEVGSDDYIDIGAAMDILAAASACPADTSPTNGGKSDTTWHQDFPLTSTTPPLLFSVS